MKRFTDTDKWKKPWYRKLSPRLKLLFGYILDNCDCAGVWDIDIEAATFGIGENCSDKDLLDLSKNVQIYQDGQKAWVSDFVSFQYGKLNPLCKPHLAVLSRLQNLPLEVLSNSQRVSLGLDKGSPRVHRTPQEKDKDKEKEKEKDLLPVNHRFQKPTLEELRLQAAKIGLPETEVQLYWNHYESNGWQVGKNPMRSWTHALANWKIAWETNRYGNCTTRSSNCSENPRNAAITHGPTDYAALAKREAAKVAQQMALPTDSPPSSPAAS